MNLSKLTEEIKSRFVHMVLGPNTDDIETQLKMFTNPELRKNAKGSKSVHKGGVKRCPHLNHFTGATSIFMNIEVLQLVSQPEIVEAFSSVYNCEQDRLGLTYGPPTILIKPESSGASPAFVYRFGDDDETLRYTGLMSLSSHKKDATAAGVQKMTGFDTYYDILSLLYDFKHHCQDDSILYLEKWFSMDSANRFLEEYTAYYNFKISDTPISLSRTIPTEVVELYESYHFEVPEVFNPLRWEDVPMPQGKLQLFSSREAIKTLPGKDKECARVYLQIPIQKLPETWKNSELRKELEESYKSGRFGDWHKPGKRCYVRENKSEYQALQQTEITNVWSYVQQHRTIFAI
jgi:hypothetical protein